LQRFSPKKRFRYPPQRTRRFSLAPADGADDILRRFSGVRLSAASVRRVTRQPG
jgi:hypothetical protein